MTTAVFRDEVTISPFARAASFLAAAILFVLPAWDLWRALWPLNALTPFFGLMVLGAALLGGLFLAVAIGSASTTLEVSSGLVRVERRWPWGLHTAVHSRATIEAIRVERSSWTDGPDTWHVEIVVAGHVVARTRSLGTQESTETAAEAIRRALGP
jgi:hypothetical protein